MRHNLLVLLALPALFGSGFLVGSRNAPVAVDSMLAEAQVVAQDRQVRYVGYLCGDDGATVIARRVPSECKDVWLLSDVDEFKAPPPLMGDGEAPLG